MSTCAPRWTASLRSPIVPRISTPATTDSLSPCSSPSISRNPMSNTPNAERKTLILTGASRGIGHATVKRFASAGWRVITCSRHAFPENCPWEMGPEDHIQVDLADPASTDAAISEIKNRLDDGELHALVNNAAISPKAEGGQRLSSIDTVQDVWRHVFQVNFLAPIMLARG